MLRTETILNSPNIIYNITFTNFKVNILPVFCSADFNNTSGGRNPGVPARSAFKNFFVMQKLQVLGLP